MELEKLPSGRLVYPEKGKEIVVKRKYEKNITWPEAVKWCNEKWGWSITPEQGRNWGTWYRTKKAGVAAERGNPRGKLWTEPENDFLREAYSHGLSHKDIAILMNETPEFEGIRTYTDRGVSVRAQRMGLKHIKLGQKLRSNLKSKEDYAERLASEGFTLLDYTNCSFYRIKCNTCGYERQGTKISMPHNCAACAEMPYSYQEVYLLKFSDFDYPSAKVGRSRDFHNERSKGFPKHEVIKVWETNFTTAVAVEELIKQQYEMYKTHPHELHFGSTAYSGSTECYDISQLEAIKETIEERLNG